MASNKPKKTEEEILSEKIHMEKVKYMYEKWRENRKLYEEQLKTGKDNGIYFCKTKQRHKNFLDFTPLNVRRYMKEWSLENQSPG